MESEGENMGFQLSRSSATLYDSRKPYKLRFTVNIMLDGTEIFATAYGESEDVARLRAAVICAAVNKMKPVDELGLTQGKTNVEK